uniref:Uncharacterized protein n=1 Tax=Oryza nivara TaxID=4536 RepID=A0A0E0IB71_ORYNI
MASASASGPGASSSAQKPIVTQEQIAAMFKPIQPVGEPTQQIPLGQQTPINQQHLPFGAQFIPEHPVHNVYQSPQQYPGGGSPQPQLLPQFNQFDPIKQQISHQNLGKTQPIQIHEHENIPQQKRARQWGSGETPVEKRYRRRGGAGEFRRQRKGTGFTSTTGGRSHALHLRSIAMDDD